MLTSKESAPLPGVSPEVNLVLYRHKTSFVPASDSSEGCPQVHSDFLDTSSGGGVEVDVAQSWSIDDIDDRIFADLNHAGTDRS
ncbi:uncharacterized protein A4U43_C04F4400 [Asparagus officinalis]|uniref:Uncharacterized protein n=1 Tax=Asparagus officinalis TaxID=4686 RepID=A0A5P1F2P9_ASPOF|nr:uncharacterized protein A4U43_C04F4400 [Asparagus officinalis]